MYRDIRDEESKGSPNVPDPNFKLKKKETPYISEILGMDRPNPTVPILPNQPLSELSRKLWDTGNDPTPEERERMKKGQASKKGIDKLFDKS